MKSHVNPCVYAPPEDCVDYNVVILFLLPRAAELKHFPISLFYFFLVVTLPSYIHHYQWCLFYVVNIYWDIFAFLPFSCLTISFCMSDFPSGIIFLLLGLHNFQISICDQHCLSLSINVIPLFLEGYFTGYKNFMLSVIFLSKHFEYFIPPYSSFHLGARSIASGCFLDLLFILRVLQFHYITI